MIIVVLVALFLVSSLLNASTVPPGPYQLCGVNVCGAGGVVANSPQLVPPCNAFQLSTGDSTTSFLAKVSNCASSKARAYVLERNSQGNSILVSTGLPSNEAVTHVLVSPDGEHATFRAGKTEGVHSWRLYRADPHGLGSVPITPSSTDGSHDVEPDWRIDCSSSWVGYVEFNQVTFNVRYVPITGGEVVPVPPPGLVWYPCDTPVIFIDGFEGGGLANWEVPA